MMKFVFALVFALGTSSVAGAGELDHERGSTNQHLQGTVVLRVDKRTNKMDYVSSSSQMTTKSQAQKFAKGASYKKIPAGKMKSELDRDGGTSSWYFYGGYYNNSYYPCYNWYGYSYYPYYSYNYGYYNYYYYGYYGYYW
jgi:hypothetical protein